MAWTVDTDVALSDLIAQIGTNLVAGGWTEVSLANRVYSSVNNQGVTQYLQITQSGSYTFLQLQGWRTHDGTTGTDGTDTNIHRIYFNGTPLDGSAICDLYMTTTTNRMIILVHVISNNWRNWAYFGGLGSLAGTNDPGAVYLLTAHENFNVVMLGQMLNATGGGTAYWEASYVTGPPGYCATAIVPGQVSSFYGDLSRSSLILSKGNYCIFPMIVSEGNSFATGATIGVGYGNVRGDLDGFFFCPINAGGLACFDALTIGAATYMVFVPNGVISDYNAAIFGSPLHQGMAIEEA